jgi:hypothetical protein
MLGRLRMRPRRRCLYIADESRPNSRPYYRLTATAGLLFAGGAWLASQAPHPGEQHRIQRTLLVPNVSDVSADRTPAVSSRLQSTSAAVAGTVPAAAPAATKHAGTPSSGGCNWTPPHCPKLSGCRARHRIWTRSTPERYCVCASGKTGACERWFTSLAPTSRYASFRQRKAFERKCRASVWRRAPGTQQRR